MNSRFAPFGSWRSPITAERITSSTVGLAEPRFTGDALSWLESRPLENGRVAIVGRTPDGAIADLIPSTFNARSRVHEMGGGAYAVTPDAIYFSDDGSGRLFRSGIGGDVGALTPEPREVRSVRYADLAVLPDGKGIVCVRETHGEDASVVNDIVWITIDVPSPAAMLVSGADFYSNPRVSPDGKRILWLSWNHPRMPWDGTELWEATLLNGVLGAKRRVAGGIEESIFQPEWSPAGDIWFVSDRTGWWNLYCERGGEPFPVYTESAEFGGPQWVFGLARYAFADETNLVAAYTVDGVDRLGVLDVRLQGLDRREVRFTEWPSPYTSIDGIAGNGAGGVAFVGGSFSAAPELVTGQVGDAEFAVVRKGVSLDIDPGYLSNPDHIEFPAEGGGKAYGFFYPPANMDFAADPDLRPPLLVTSHGGPTGAASTSLQLAIQYWTSRGFGVVDVNYGGSTGYGREYRRRLDGRWGVVDVEDCVNAARYLVHEGRVDPRSIAIRGKSASGLTTLNALISCDMFSAGASYYGVADLEAMVSDTHKFESRYMDRLIGPYPEFRELYRERSPIRHLDQLRTPIIMLQGLEDRIVPPSQAEAMVRSLRRKGLPFAYLTFPGEQHGFRKASTVRRALEAELYFYSRIFGFDAADSVEPVDIENLP